MEVGANNEKRGTAAMIQNNRGKMNEKQQNNKEEDKIEQHK